MSDNTEQVWFQVQFLNLHNTYEDCVDATSRDIGEAIGYFNKKKRLLNIPLRIVERKLSERTIPESEIKSK